MHSTPFINGPHVKRPTSGRLRNLEDSASRKLGDNRFDGGRLDAFLALYVDCCRRIVVSGFIRDGGIGVKGRTNQADVDFFPGCGVGAAIDVVTDNILRGGRIPVQVHDMVCSGLDDDLVGRLRGPSAAAGDFYGEGIRNRFGRCAGEVIGGRVRGHLRGNAGGQRAGDDSPFIRSATVDDLDSRRVSSINRAVRHTGSGDFSVCQALNAK
jgi:hypothetical protein